MGIESDNPVISVLCQLSLLSNTRLGNSVRSIFKEADLEAYKWSFYNEKLVSGKLVSKWFLNCDEKNVNVGAQIREVIQMQDTFTPKVLDRHECCFVINELCTL